MMIYFVCFVECGCGSWVFLFLSVFVIVVEVFSIIFCVVFFVYSGSQSCASMLHCSRK